jgi:hypothetical protein
MIEPNNPILCRMLERLFSAMVNGPSMNCRPHASRQRLDFVQIARFKDASPKDLFLSLIGESGAAAVTARVPMPPRREHLDDELAQSAQNAWSEQQAVRNKLRLIADDARTYEQDTGVHALNLGFPLLSLPPATFGGRFGAAPSRRVLAPIAFIPLSLIVRSGAKDAIELTRHDGSDPVIPNIALLSWLEQQTGRSIPQIIGDDEDSKDIWRRICDLVESIANLVELSMPESMHESLSPTAVTLDPTPAADDHDMPTIVSAAVLGLYPAANQGLLRDTREMIAGGAAAGPLEHFVRLSTRRSDASVARVSAETRATDASPPQAQSNAGVAESVAGAAGTPAPCELGSTARIFAAERLVADADPCQARAVRLAGQARGLVIHGPPGTGKSQTITNVISDHLARGQRVLFVCDKRTALDVVADRLNVLGLGDLCAIIHDPQRDQRELYRSIREQLDALADAELNPRAQDELNRIDAELQALHEDLSAHHRALIGDGAGPGTFHHLVGLWLAETGAPDARLDEQAIADSPAADLRVHGTRLKEVLERGAEARLGTNPWTSAAGMALADFLSTPTKKFRSALASCQADAAEVDDCRDPLSPAYAPDEELIGAAHARRALAGQLRDVLDRVSPRQRARWAKEPAPRIAAASDQLANSAQWIDTLRQTSASAGLANEPTQANDLTTAPDTGVPAAESASPDQLARQRQVLASYITAFQAAAADLRRVRKAAPDADDLSIVRWLGAGANATAAALRKLESALPLAEQVDSLDLDATLLARFERAPVDARQITQWQAALATYLETAGTARGAFAFAPKKAAGAVARHFGLPLGAPSAVQLLDFLTNLQARLDLQMILEAVTAQPFAGRAEDQELLTAFWAQYDALTEINRGESSHPTEPIEAPEVAEEIIPAINGLLAPTAAAATTLLVRFGLSTNPLEAARLERALARREARARLAALYDAIVAEEAGSQTPADEALIRGIEAHRSMIEMLAGACGDPSDAVAASILHALKEPDAAPGICRALHDAPIRAERLDKLEKALETTHLLDARWLTQFSADIRAGGAAGDVLARLAESFGMLEGVLRVRDGIAQLPPALGEAARTLLESGATPADGYSAVRRTVLAAEISRKLKQEPNLQAVDGRRLQTTFDRYRELCRRKLALARQVIRHQWTAKQQQRLLVGSGSRLNGAGADLRRRLTGRGERAMRLRQVIAHGAGAEGGDPLFDLRPVWMASPETVAQLFPRQPIFDVIVFDEASQCRLEEALPTLTRARRVVIAGDPRQLPPTRFFESTVAASADDADDADTEQELFEAHQGEIEDLLSAALGLDIHQCYLDVHYRSRNADLIGFSNEQFYSSRLQSIPSHPRHRTRVAPLSLHRVDGIYEKRGNDAEADKVVQVVRELLNRPNPPSIGIACFNLVQREMILEKLEELAEADADFASRLTDSRLKRGSGSSDGLFVKNLENVQGDERDHLIISTTFGPDRSGKFRRNFGPVGQPGGGRRLNVLITRAREHVHIVTSIPRSAYASLPAIPEGRSPSGIWLLFAYLQYAEQLSEDYETAYRILESSQATAGAGAGVHVRSSRTPSQFARSLAARLAAAHGIGSDVHWGNDGFCVDVALLHPARAEDVTVGILCDTTRFAGSDDAIEWEVFRTAMLERQGWKLHRVWTPHFFRDPSGCCAAILKDVESALTSESGDDPAATAAATPAAAAPMGPAKKHRKSRGSDLRDKNAA